MIHGTPPASDASLTAGADSSRPPVGDPASPLLTRDGGVSVGLWDCSRVTLLTLDCSRVTLLQSRRPRLRRRNSADHAVVGQRHHPVELPGQQRGQCQLRGRGPGGRGVHRPHLGPHGKRLEHRPVAPHEQREHAPARRVGERLGLRRGDRGGPAGRAGGVVGRGLLRAADVVSSAANCTRAKVSTPDAGSSAGRRAR